MVCLGATKAGTSSLYKYLHDHSECHLRSLKELQYFSAIEFNDYDHQYSVLDRACEDLAKRREVMRQKDDLWRVRNIERQINDRKEMRRILEKGQSGITDYLYYLLDGLEGYKLTADISPAYACLPQWRLEQIATMAPNVKFVYLLRDPVDRLWSHVRMLTERRLLKPENAGKDFHEHAKGLLRSAIKTKNETHILERGQYKEIIIKLRKAIPKDRLFIGFSETVFQEAGLRDLCAFLGISYKADTKAPHRHQGKKSELRGALKQRAVRFLADEYKFVFQQIGDPPDRWLENSSLLLK